MIIPPCSPVLTVVAVAAIPTARKSSAGVLVGSIVTGLFMGISMTSSGGAWDNAKIHRGRNHGAQKSEAHKASVTGDTVGDPYRTPPARDQPMIKVVTSSRSSSSRSFLKRKKTARLLRELPRLGGGRRFPCRRGGRALRLCQHIEQAGRHQRDGGDGFGFTSRFSPRPVFVRRGDW